MTTRGQIAGGVDSINLAGSGGSNLVGFLQAGTGAVARTVQGKERDIVSVKDFGAVGDGVTDDTAAMGAFLTAASNNVNIIPAGTYKLTSLLTKALSNCSFIGAPGATIITGAFGNAIIKFLALNNVHFYGITFQTTYSSAAEDTTSGLVYSLQTDVNNVTFSHCEFIAASANTQGIAFYPRTTTGDTSAVIDGLWIEDCKFNQTGRMGVILMNRYTGADNYNAARRVYFRRNHVYDTGRAGTYGQGISLDGFGSAWEIDGNLFDNNLTSCIETTGWSYGVVKHNRFRNFVKLCTPWTIGADNTSATPATDVEVFDNRTLSNASQYPTWINIKDSKSRDNLTRYDAAIIANAQVFACYVLNANNCEWSGDTFINNDAVTYGRHALYVASNNAKLCKGNKFTNCTFDNSLGLSNFAVVRFTGADTQNNIIDSCVFVKGSGGVNVDEASSAASNSIIGTCTSKTDPQLFGSISQSVSTSDVTLTIEQAAANTITLTGTPAAGRNIILPTWKRMWTISNQTTQTMTIKPASGSGVAIATNKNAIVYGTGSAIGRSSADA